MTQEADSNPSLALATGKRSPTLPLANAQFRVRG
jgi:hypothetical protein